MPTAVRFPDIFLVWLPSQSSEVVYLAPCLNSSAIQTSFDWATKANMQKRTAQEILMTYCLIQSVVEWLVLGEKIKINQILANLRVFRSNIEQSQGQLRLSNYFMMQPQLTPQLQVSITQQDFQVSRESQSQKTEKLKESLLSQFPHIIRPSPFAHLFSEPIASSQGKQIGFSGVFRPNNKQITHAVKLLKDAMNSLTEKTKQSLISQYYASFIYQLQVKQQEKKQSQDMRNSSFSVSQANIFCRHVRRGKMENQIQEQKCKEKRIVVRSFCSNGYCLDALGCEMREGVEKCKIYKDDYECILLSVVAETLRRMEQFLLIDCQKDIELLTIKHVKSIFPILLDCREYFTSKLCQVWFRMMKSCFGIAAQTLGQQEVLAVYSHIQYLLTKDFETSKIKIDFHKCFERIKRLEPGVWAPISQKQKFKTINLKAINKFRMHQIWSRKYQEKLITVYKRTDDFMHITQYFKNTYPHHSQYFSEQALSSRLFKLLVLSLSKLKLDLVKSGSNAGFKPLKLSQIQIKLLIHDPDAFQIRKELIDYYSNNLVLRQGALSSAVNSIKSYLDSKVSELNHLHHLQQAVSAHLKQNYKVSSQTISQLNKSEIQNMGGYERPGVNKLINYSLQPDVNEISQEKQVINGQLKWMGPLQVEEELILGWLQPEYGKIQ